MKEKHYRASRLMRELGVPIRYQIVKLLEKGPRTVGELAELLDRHPATISHHLHILRAVDAVRYETKGRNAVYWLKAELIPSLLALAERCAAKLQIEGKKR